MFPLGSFNAKAAYSMSKTKSGRDLRKQRKKSSFEGEVTTSNSLISTSAEYNIYKKKNQLVLKQQVLLDSFLSRNILAEYSSRMYVRYPQILLPLVWH